MKVLILKFIFCLFILESCEIAVPNSSTDGESSVTNLRNVNMKCKVPLACNQIDLVDRVIYARARYTEIKCDDIDYKSEFFAESSSLLKCSAENCHALLRDFSNIQTNDSFVENGVYNLYVFIDFNENESVDSDEPYFCSDNVELNSTKRLVNIEVDITRLYEE